MKSVFLMILPLVAGWLLDIVFGDPRWVPHPVKLIGHFIDNLEPVLFDVFPQNPRGEQNAGNLLALLVPLVSLLMSAITLAFVWLYSQSLWILLDTLLCYGLFSSRSLRDESMRVCKLLENREEHGDLSRARLALSRITRRETGRLNSKEITRATIETVADGTIESAIAPMFFIALGGGALGVFYKAVNTLYHAVGRDTPKYRYFGIPAAKLNEICGFIPSRIAAVIMIFSAWVAGFDSKEAARVRKLERANHDGANAVQAEAVCAGALGIRLGGGSYHDGAFYSEPVIGGGKRVAETKDIRFANRILMLTSFFGVAFFAAVKFFIVYIVVYY